MYRAKRTTGRNRQLALILGLLFVCGLIANLTEARFTIVNAVNIGMYLFPILLWGVVSVYRRYRRKG